MGLDACFVSIGPSLGNRYRFGVHREPCTRRQTTPTRRGESHGERTRPETGSQQRHEQTEERAGAAARPKTGAYHNTPRAVAPRLVPRWATRAARDHRHRGGAARDPSPPPPPPPSFVDGGVPHLLTRATASRLQKSARRRATSASSRWRTTSAGTRTASSAGRRCDGGCFLACADGDICRLPRVPRE